jgi:hypothetical protein
VFESAVINRFVFSLCDIKRFQHEEMNVSLNGLFWEKDGPSTRSYFKSSSRGHVEVHNTRSQKFMPSLRRSVLHSPTLNSISQVTFGAQVFKKLCGFSGP